MSYPRFYYKLTNEKGKGIYTYHTGNNRRFVSKLLSVLNSRELEKISIYVSARYSENYGNEHESRPEWDVKRKIKEAKLAVSAFTEKDLVEEFAENS